MMRYTREEVENMRARGCTEDLMRRALAGLETGEAADALIRRIAEVFEGVRLGEGAGLWEAQGLDDYDDEEERAALRAKDEKEDWRRISADDLNRCGSSLSFFDAEGMRFHLPTYMTEELRGNYFSGTIFTLTYLNDLGRSQFAGLTPAQRAAVREYLLLLRDDPDTTAREREEITRALEEYWTGEGEPPPAAVSDRVKRDIDGHRGFDIP